MTTCLIFFLRSLHWRMISCIGRKWTIFSISSFSAVFFRGAFLHRKHTSVFLFSLPFSLYSLVIDTNTLQVPFIQAVNTFVYLHFVVPAQAV